MGALIDEGLGPRAMCLVLRRDPPTHSYRLFTANAINKTRYCRNVLTSLFHACGQSYSPEADAGTDRGIQRGVRRL